MNILSIQSTFPQGSGVYCWKFLQFKSVQMDSNDLNRRIRYAFMLDDADVSELLKLVDFEATLAQIATWREREGAEGYQPCPAQAVNCMLDGLIVRHRGARAAAPTGSAGSTVSTETSRTTDVSVKGSDTNSDTNNSTNSDTNNSTNSDTNNSTNSDTNNSTNSGTNNSERIIDNNEVLKKLRIAMSLKTDDVHAVIVQGGGKLGKSEVGALFRKTTARNYRRCGDQVLRWFLAGLAARRSENPLT